MNNQTSSPELNDIKWKVISAGSHSLLCLECPPEMMLVFLKTEMNASV